MVEKVDQVTLGIGQGISAEELAASVHDCSIDELRAAKAFAAGRQQGLREAVEVAKERHNEWQFAIGNGLKRVAVSKGYAEGGSSEAEVIAAAITALIEGEGR